MAALTRPNERKRTQEEGFVSSRTAAVYPNYGTTGFVSTGNPSNTQGHGVVVSGPRLPAKSLLDAYLLCLPFGFLGLHHFYLRRYGFGFVYLFTGGLVGVGWLVDIFRLPSLVREVNSKLMQPVNDDGDVPQVSLVDAYLLWFPLGILGLHHYYLRRPVWGLAYTFSAGIFGLGWLIDAFRMPSLVRGTNGVLRKRHFEIEAAPFRRKKNLCDAYVLCLVPPLGILGAHHFYLNRYMNGVFYFLTLGGGGVGWIVDWFRLKELVDRANHPERYSLGHRQKFLDDAYVYAFPMGVLGSHHFYLERPMWGLLYLFTGGLFGIGWLVDLCRMPFLVKEANQMLEMRRNFAAVASCVVVQGPQNAIPYHGVAASNSGIIQSSSNGTLYVAGVSNCSTNQENPYPPPYDSFQSQPPSNGSWVSISSAPPSSATAAAAGGVPGGFVTGPPSYSSVSQKNDFSKGP